MHESSSVGAETCDDLNLETHSQPGLELLASALRLWVPTAGRHDCLAKGSNRNYLGNDG